MPSRPLTRVDWLSRNRWRFCVHRTQPGALRYPISARATRHDGAKHEDDSLALYSMALPGLIALAWSADRFVEGASAIAKRAGQIPMLIG